MAAIGFCLRRLWLNCRACRWPRVTAFILEPHGEGFAALARRAGLKNGVLVAFRAALAALKTQVGAPGDALKLSLVQKAIDACEQRNDPALAKVRALLWRFAAEAAKTEATRFAREATIPASGGRLPLVLEFSPVNDNSGQASKLIEDFGSPRKEAAPLELAAPSAPLGEDKAPPIELPPELVARLNEAA